MVVGGNFLITKFVPHKYYQEGQTQIVLCRFIMIACCFNGVLKANGCVLTYQEEKRRVWSFILRLCIMVNKIHYRKRPVAAAFNAKMRYLEQSNEIIGGFPRMSSRECFHLVSMK